MRFSIILAIIQETFSAPRQDSRITVYGNWIKIERLDKKSNKYYLVVKDCKVRKGE